MLASALFCRIEVLGLQEATVHITDDAVRHGVAGALPAEVAISVSGRGERARASLTQQSLRFLMINRTPRESLPGDGTKRMRDGYLRGALSRPATQRQMDVLAAFVEAGGSVPDAADLVGIRPSTAKRHLADLRAKSGFSTEQLIYVGRAAGWLVVPSLEPK